MPLFRKFSWKGKKRPFNRATSALRSSAFRRKRPSFKGKAFLRKGSFSSTATKRWGMFKKKRSSFGRGGLTQQVRKITRKLRSVPTPTPTRITESVQWRTDVPTGFGLIWESGGGQLTASGTQCGLTSCPMDPVFLCLMPLNNNGSGSALGASKSVINRWRSVWEFQNPNNFPLTIEFITLKCIADLPLEATSGTDTPGPEEKHNFGVVYQNWVHAQYNDAAYSISADKLLANPTWRLQDCVMFNRYFRVKRVITKNMSSMKTLRISKFSNRARIIDESMLFNDTASAVRMAAMKGCLYYIWRVRPMVMGGSDGGADKAKISYPAYGISCLQNVLWDCSYLSHDQHAFHTTSSWNSPAAPLFWHVPLNAQEAPTHT